MTGLLKPCCGHLIRNLTQDNSPGAPRFAKKHQCHGLEKSAPRFTLKHFSQICTQSNEFVQLPIDIPCPIPSSDPLNTGREEYVFDAICRWIDPDPQARFPRQLSIFHFRSLSY